MKRREIDDVGRLGSRTPSEGVLERVRSPAGATSRTLLTRLPRLLGRARYEMLKHLHRTRRDFKHQERWPPAMPLVTVVIPCYNYGRFVKEAIASACAQTLQRLEILVIDDGSTDPFTLTVLGELNCTKARIVRQSNQGLAATRNRGAQLASGKYLCYLDADDWLEPTYLEKTVTMLEADENLGSCYSWVRCFGKADSVWKTVDLDPYLLRDSTTAPSHSVIRKEAWQRVRDRNGSGFLSKYDGFFEDWVFWIDMIHCGYCGKTIPEPLIHYRVHDASLSAGHKDRLAGMIATLHADRDAFFHDRRFPMSLWKAMNHRLYVKNPRINLDRRGDSHTKRTDGAPVDTGYVAVAHPRTDRSFG